jgi:nucleotide-binding universal stress UspA family protein
LTGPRRHEARHILVPLDGSELSEGILEPALSLGSLSGARYTLLRIVLPVPFAAGPQMAGVAFAEGGAEQSRLAAAAYLEQAAARLRPAARRWRSRPCSTPCRRWRSSITPRPTPWT